MSRITGYMVFMILGIHLQAQSLIQYGDNFESSISTLGEVDTFFFEGTAGDIIYLRMRDETKVDSHIKLNDPDGSLIINKFSDGGLAEIKDFQLQKTGTYRLRLADKNHNDTGVYGFSIHKLNGPLYAVPLKCHENFSGEIKLITEVQAFTFSAEENDAF